jgi:hypothetical protein
MFTKIVILKYRIKIFVALIYSTFVHFVKLLHTDLIGEAGT